RRGSFRSPCSTRSTSKAARAATSTTPTSSTGRSTASATPERRSRSAHGESGESERAWVSARSARSARTGAVRFQFGECWNTTTALSLGNACSRALAAPASQRAFLAPLPTDDVSATMSGFRNDHCAYILETRLRNDDQCDQPRLFPQLYA